MSALEFAVITLAVYRVSRMITMENGPRIVPIDYGIRDACFLWWRDKVGVRPTEDGQDVLPADPGSWADLFSCMWCMSIWVALVACVGFYFAPVLVVCLSVPLAMSALASILFDLEQRL